MRKNIVTECLVAGIFISLVALFASAQEKTGMSADQTLRSNARVNPSTLGMELSIPLAAYPGRGPGASVSLSYSSKLWRLADGGIHQPVGSPQCITLGIPQYGELSAAGWTTNAAVPHVEYVGRENIYRADGHPMTVPTPGCDQQWSNTGGYYIRRIIVHLPGGESHELRVDDNGVAFQPGNQNDPFWPTNQANWNTAYYAADGSNLKYVEDSTTGTYRLLLADGGLIDFGGSLETLTTFDISRTIRRATTLKDKHGNTITYHPPDTNHPNGYQTDTLGREIATPIGLEPPADPTPSASPQAYSVPGFGTANLTYYLHWKRLKGATAAESALTTFSDTLCYKARAMPGEPPPQACGLFGDTSQDGKHFWSVSPVGDGEFNPVVLARIDLPNGASYKFGYDIYGRINKIDYPTGASETFTYSAVEMLKRMDHASDAYYKQANFGVTHREVLESTGATPAVWDYSAVRVQSWPYVYKVRTVNPDGTKAERYLTPGDEAATFGYDTPLAGMVYEERSYTSAQTDTLLAKTLTTWEQTSFSTFAGNVRWHPRVTKVESITCDPLTAACLSSTTTTGYVGTLSQITDAVNPNLVTQYGFSTVIGTLGALERSV